MNRDVLCLGNRIFMKKLRCNWTGGHRWSTALILSVTLGGFGIDRYSIIYRNIFIIIIISCFQILDFEQ